MTPDESADESPDTSADLLDSIIAGDTDKTRSLFLDAEFIMIKVSEPDEQDDEEHVGALTANVDDMDVLIVFTNEEHAGNFVQTMGELFDESDEIEGFFVDGGAVLEYLPDGFGLLINPESDDSAVMQNAMLDELRTSS
ncbi:MAG: hypothetical protein HKN47_22885 [Pirellulaceae bacterium]|nr:hypothetical protein [Pirellulaceae bacterium]